MILSAANKQWQISQKWQAASDKNYDSVGYYSLLVKTEIDYYDRLIKGDTPVAMLGANGLVDMLKQKRFSILLLRSMNCMKALIRYKVSAIEPLNAQELYYMMVFGENDIYTSSYKYSFDRMIQKMGPVPHGDSFLLSVNFDGLRSL